MKRDERGSWYLLTGLVLGILMGLFYTWWVRPVSYTNTTPASLRADFKDQYRALIAAAYLGNGDLVRAKARLELLKDEDVYRALAEQAQRMLAEGSSANEARALGLLAVELGQAPAAVSESPPAPGTTITETLAGVTPSPGLDSSLPAVSQESPGSSDSLPTAIPTSTEIPSDLSTPASLPEGNEVSLPATTAPTLSALPTHTPTPAPAALYVLVNREKVCDPGLEEPVIQVQVQDANGEPAPGVEFVVRWDGGEDRFFTGLKPELGLGYADFAMTPGVTYTLLLVEGGEPVTGLATSECEAPSGGQYRGSWLLTFKQP